MRTLLIALWGWIHRSLCALRGHDELLEFEPGRLLLRCASCGHATQGWEVGVVQSESQFNTDRAMERGRQPARRFAREHQAA